MKTKFILILLIIYISCSQQIPERRYYVIDYNTEPDTNFIAACSTATFPLNYKVIITPLKIPRIYDRKNIVVRYSTTELNFYRYNLWALRPDENLTDLIYRQIRNSKIFNKVATEFIKENPDLEIRGEILSIEQYYYKSEDQKIFYSSAHLAMKLQLYDFEHIDPLLEYSFDKTKDIYKDDINYFVLQIANIVKEETNNFIKKIVDYYCEKDSTNK